MGHNLTDESTSLINNFFDQNLMSLSGNGPKAESDVEGNIPQIKPLYEISEEEIVMYAYYSKIDFLPTECPYSDQSPNLKLKKAVQEIEDGRKATMISLVRKYRKNIKPILTEAFQSQVIEHQEEVGKCESCGSPSYSKLCPFCKLTSFLKERFNQSKKF